MTRAALAPITFLGIAAALAAATPFLASAQAPPGTPATPDSTRPAVTLLYQNFPNPFPSADSRTTCIWFDLSGTTTVSLTIHDVRGNLVRRLLPNASVPQFLAPGRYGRATDTADSGCGAPYAWDGRADNGSTVPRGVYLIRLRAGGTESIKKAVFRGS